MGTAQLPFPGIQHDIMIESLINEYKQIELPDDERFIELDMGCGKGKFTLELAAKYPDRLILSSDVMSGRLRKIENKVKRDGIGNIRILRGESGAMARFQLPTNSIDRIHILFPDPWPKDKGKARRLVCTSFLCSLFRVLKPGGILHLATDYQPYFNDWKRILENLPFYENSPNASDDLRDIKTDFELQWEADGIPARHLNVIAVK